jgi:photosystem II stability/assembly factor-like uncharacterized protein
MDKEPSQRISERGKRGLRVITIAAVAIVAASIAWLYPTMASHTNSVSPLPTPWSTTTPNNFVRYQFIDPSVGWAVGVSAGSSNPGRFWVSRTVDGAQHWETQLRGQVGTRYGSPSSIQLFDKHHGFVAVGVPVATYRTLDGGKTWKAVSLPDEEGAVVTFSDARHGWLQAGISQGQIQSNRLYVTEDAGDTWRRLPDPPAQPSNIVFRSPQEGWFWSRGQASSVIYVSSDGGESWQGRYIPEPSGRPPGQAVVVAGLRLLPGVGVVATVAFSDGLRIQGFQDFTSYDMGRTWNKVVRPLSQASFLLESFEDATHWWAIDLGGLYKSSDGGQTWKLVRANMENWENWSYYIQVIDSMHAVAQVAMGEVSGLVMTSDGGMHWTRANVPAAAG